MLGAGWGQALACSSVALPAPALLQAVAAAQAQAAAPAAGRALASEKSTAGKLGAISRIERRLSQGLVHRHSRQPSHATIGEQPAALTAGCAARLPGTSV